MTTLLPPEAQPPVHSQADLEALWRDFMGPLGFSRTTLWIVFLEADGTLLPTVLPIEDIPSRPTDALDGLTEVCRGLTPAGGSVAFLLTRPGPDEPITPAERAWTRALGLVGQRVGATVWPVHRANDDALRACTPDDLAA